MMNKYTSFPYHIEKSFEQMEIKSLDTIKIGLKALLKETRRTDNKYYMLVFMSYCRRKFHKYRDHNYIEIANLFEKYWVLGKETRKKMKYEPKEINLW